MAASDKHGRTICARRWFARSSSEAPKLEPDRIGDVIVGCAMPEGEQGMNVGRNVALLAGLPDAVCPA